MKMYGPTVAEGSEVTNLSLPTGTAAELAALGSPNDGEMFYQTDGTKGVYAYIDSVWSTLGEAGTLTTHISDATLHITSGQNTLLDGITVTYAEINQTGGTLTTGFQQDKGTLTDQATVAIDFSVSNAFNWTVGGSRTLSFPTNITSNGGVTYVDVTADGSGPYTISLAAGYNLVSGDLIWDANEVRRMWLVIRTTSVVDVYTEDIA